jgi:hypothetical protein
MKVCQAVTLLYKQSLHLSNYSSYKESGSHNLCLGLVDVCQRRLEDNITGGWEAVLSSPFTNFFCDLSTSLNTLHPSCRDTDKYALWQWKLTKINDSLSNHGTENTCCLWWSVLSFGDKTRMKECTQFQSSVQAKCITQWTLHSSSDYMVSNSFLHDFTK